MGRASSGKTYEIMERICNDVKKGKRPILLVTEQFSFESERTLLEHLGDALSKNVSVVSFTRLCDDIEREVGGVCGTVLDDCGKIILINRALKQSFSELKLWKKYVNSNSFAQSLLNIIAEFKLNAVTPEKLFEVSEKITDEILKFKLLDIATVYECYESLVAERFIDPDGRLDKLYDSLSKSDYFKNRPVYIDSFFGFTGQQYRIIDRIMNFCETLTVSLCADKNDKREFSPFSNINRVKSRILQMAKRNGKKVYDDIYLENQHYKNPQMQNVENLMFEGKLANENVSGENVTVCCADTVFDEAEFVARTIRKTVREENARYSDFVVIARDISLYEEAFVSACKKNGVNCFADSRIALYDMPPASCALAACELALSMTSENIFKFLKSGVSLLTTQEIATIENYVFVWNIKGSDWKNKWEMTPSGLVRKEDDLNKKAKEQLEYINTLREKAINPILRFKENFKGSAKQRTISIVKLFDECNAKESFLNIALIYKEKDSAFYDAIKQSFDVLMELFNNLHLCFGDAEITSKDFSAALRTGISFQTIGVAPQMADEVTFGSADRIRPSRPKYAFIMGANQGVFPRGIKKGGILNISERQKLIGNEIDISDNTYDIAIDEEYLVYSSVCCPSDKLFISYSKNISSAQGEKSPFVETILNGVNCVVLNEPQSLEEANLPETERAAFSEYCKRYSLDDGSCNILKSAIESKETKNQIDVINKDFENNKFLLSEDTARKLYGNNVRLSPSKIDTFEKCRFVYFCKYGLGAKKLQSAEFNSMQRGTISHYVLQKLIETYGKNLKDFSDLQIKENVDTFCEEYLNSVEGYRAAESAYSKYLVSTIKDILYTVVGRIRNEFLQSDFTPVKCELNIGYNGDINPIELVVDDKTSLTLNGKIDRVDKWNGYVRIVDYKSSYKTFTVPDILIGKNLQMILYLYAVCKTETFGGKPAGVFYLPIKKFKSGETGNPRMNGISLNDTAVLNAMEKGNGGEYVPKMTKTGENGQFVEEEDFTTIFNYVESRIKNAAKILLSGDVTALPQGAKGDKVCEYCDYRGVCHKATDTKSKMPRYKKTEALSIMNGEEIESDERQGE